MIAAHPTQRRDSGSDWLRRIGRFACLDNTNDRRAMIIWASTEA
jgi:hypothetical protein